MDHSTQNDLSNISGCICIMYFGCIISQSNVVRSLFLCYSHSNSSNGAVLPSMFDISLMAKTPSTTHIFRLFKGAETSINLFLHLQCTLLIRGAVSSCIMCGVTSLSSSGLSRFLFLTTSTFSLSVEPARVFNSQCQFVT